MLPAYLTFVVSGAEHSRAAAVGRAAMATVAMTAGFVAVFATFGLLAVSIASTVQRYIPAVTVVVGVALLVAGLWMLSGRSWAWRYRGASREHRPRGWGRCSATASAYAVASLSCTVGPFLAVTASATRIDSHGDAIVVYGAYAAGFALVVGTLAVAAAFTSAALSARLRQPFAGDQSDRRNLGDPRRSVRRLLRDLRTAPLPWQRIARGRGDQCGGTPTVRFSPAGLTATAAGRGCWPWPCWRRLRWAWLGGGDARSR